MLSVHHINDDGRVLSGIMVHMEQAKYQIKYYYGSNTMDPTILVCCLKDINSSVIGTMGC